MDIRPFMTSFLNSIFGIFTSCFNILDSIQFNGISLLSYIICIQIILIILPLLLTLTKTKGVKGKSNARQKESKSTDEE